MIQCPNASTLSRFLLGDLSSTEAFRIGEHIDGCAACQSTLERLAEPGELSELRPHGPARSDEPVERRPGLMRILTEIRSRATPHDVAIETTDDRAMGLPVPLGPPRREGDVGS